MIRLVLSMAANGIHLRPDALAMVILIQTLDTQQTRRVVLVVVVVVVAIPEMLSQ